jgi:pyruvate-formate lyase-activating enzyme
MSTCLAGNSWGECCALKNEMPLNTYRTYASKALQLILPAQNIIKNKSQKMEKVYNLIKEYNLSLEEQNSILVYIADLYNNNKINYEAYGKLSNLQEYRDPDIIHLTHILAENVLNPNRNNDMYCVYSRIVFSDRSR